MPNPIGFVLLTHEKPLQAIRLLKKLNVMFDNPPVAWHHDFGQCDLPLDRISGNVSLIRPHIATNWAGFSLVDAAMSALARLFESQDKPTWFVLLSGADYPIKSATKILNDLSASEYDAHLHHEKIMYGRYDRRWQEICFHRYCTLPISVPHLNRSLRLKWRTIRFAHPLITSPFLPFSNSLACFAGEHWFCANQQAAEYLLEFYRTKPRLANYYRWLASRQMVHPSESYYQTVLCNAPHLRVSNNHWRYIDWSRDKAHPKTLMTDDLPALYGSPAHFARKFDVDIDTDVLDALDAIT